MRLFILVRPIEFIAIYIFGILPNTESGNQFIVVMVDRFLKLTKVTPTTIRIETIVSSILFNDELSNFRIPPKVLTDNGLQFTSNFFQAIRAELQEEC